MTQPVRTALVVGGVATGFCVALAAYICFVMWLFASGSALLGWVSHAIIFIAICTAVGYAIGKDNAKQHS